MSVMKVSLFRTLLRDAKYMPADLDEIVHKCIHLADEAQAKLKTLLKKYEHLFDGTLRVWNTEPALQY